MVGLRRGLTLVGVVMAILVRAACAQVATTTVQDTVYRADGTTAGGTVLVSWSGFTTAAGSAVPTGTTSVTIGTGGLLTVALAPNAGATPMGSYYTAVFHLDDGSTSREYWVIPVTVPGGGTVKLSAIINSVLPASMAMQTVSKNYVDTAIALAVTGHPLDSTPYVLKTGDTMSGPLELPADPVSDNQAADKHYVDVNVAAAASGLGRKVDELPGTTQVVAQPVGTQLDVNNLNGSLYASQYVSVAGDDGITNVLASPDCVGAISCSVQVEPTYNLAEGIDAQIPSHGRVTDERGGSVAETTLNPLSPIQNGTSLGRDLTIVSTQLASDVKTAFPGVSEVDAIGLRIVSEGLAGGSNQFPAGIETVPYFKSTFSATNITGRYNTEGQHDLNNNITFCYGVGDCLLGSHVIRASGGTRDVADEGTHPFDVDIAEDTAVFRGTCGSGCSTGSTVLNVTVSNDGGTQGEGRFLIDKNPAKILTTGTLTGGVMGAPFAKAEFSGTSFAASVFLTTTNAALSQPSNLAPGTVTMTVATSGVTAGFSTNTAALPSGSGVACVADPHGPGAAGFANFEMANYTVIDGTHVRLTLNKVHGAGTTIAVGGLCGYGLEQTVDTVGAIRQVFPVVGSSSATELYYTDARTAIVGISGTTSNFVNILQHVAAISRTGNVVTVTMTGFLMDVSGLTLTVSGVADSSYNGNYVVTSTGPTTLTYSNTGANSTSSGGTLAMITGGFVLYPMAEVLGVLDPANKSVDGYLQLGANTAPWAAGDALEEPHYFQEDVSGEFERITQFTPRPSGFDRTGMEYIGTVGPSVHGWTVANDEPNSDYIGNGGLHSLPQTAYEVQGPWQNILTTQAGDQTLFNVSCNSHGCNRYDSNYALFELNSAIGVDLLNYYPQSNIAQWSLAGVTYTFSPTAFTAQTINVGTLNATTITGGVSAGAITSGTIGVARLPVFGASGTTHSAGIVPDPGATAGTTKFLREDGTFAVPAGSSGGVSGTPTIAVGAAAGSGASATISGNNAAGVITLITGTGTTAAATLTTITFNGTLGTAPLGCALMSRNANASGQVAVLYTTAPSTTTWTIAVAGAALAASTNSYQWSYQCN
jgi:trimeric autotransporter adhesin